MQCLVQFIWFRDGSDFALAAGADRCHAAQEASRGARRSHRLPAVLPTRRLRKAARANTGGGWRGGVQGPLQQVFRGMGAPTIVKCRRQPLALRNKIISTPDCQR